MTDPTEQQARDPTVLAVSRYGTFWLLDARSGALRWRLVNGSHPAAIDHGGEMLYITYISAATVRRDTRKPMVQIAKLQHLSPDELRQYYKLLVLPAELLALRAEDGTITWRLEGWVGWNQPRPVIHGGHRLDGDLVITDVTDFADATPVVAALDARTGAVRWRYKGIDVSESSHTQATMQLQGACAGKVYISQPAQSRLDVLNSASGHLVWSCEHTDSEWYLSPGGVLLAEVSRGEDQSLVVRQTSNGQVTVRLALSPLTTFLGLTDAGIAYLASGPNWHRWVEALDTSIAESTWRAERSVPLLSTNMDISIFSDNAFITHNSLYFARLNHASSLAEALALDIQSGHQCWYWHGPSHLLALLKLCAWRTPHVVAFAISQFRRSRRSAGRRMAKQTIWTKIRSLWDTIRWDILRGQWLRPESLLSTVLSERVWEWVRLAWLGMVTSGLAACEHAVNFLWEGQPNVSSVRRQPRADILDQGFG
jgi:hypothetical protein